MVNYLAAQITKGSLKYSEVIEKYPDLKEEIDEVLKKKGYIVKEEE